MSDIEALQHTDAFLTKTNQEEPIRAMHDWNIRALKGQDEIEIYNSIKSSYGKVIADYVSDAVAYRKSHLTDKGTV